jgi:hypothetical protein
MHNRSGLKRKGGKKKKTPTSQGRMAWSESREKLGSPRM